MKAIAVKQSSNDSTRNHKGKIQTPIPSAARASVFSSRDIGIQRKPTCPCGGGCPRCEEELPIQSKLKINKPGDLYEQEADRVVEQVMRMPKEQPEEEPVPVITPSVQRQIDEEEEDFLQTKELPGKSPEIMPAVSSRIQSLKGGGQPLPDSARQIV